MPSPSTAESKDAEQLEIIYPKLGNIIETYLDEKLYRLLAADKGLKQPSIQMVNANYILPRVLPGYKAEMPDDLRVTAEEDANDEFEPDAIDSELLTQIFEEVLADAGHKCSLPSVSTLADDIAEDFCLSEDEEDFAKIAAAAKAAVDEYVRDREVPIDTTPAKEHSESSVEAVAPQPVKDEMVYDLEPNYADLEHLTAIYTDALRGFTTVTDAANTDNSSVNSAEFVLEEDLLAEYASTPEPAPKNNFLYGFYEYTKQSLTTDPVATVALGAETAVAAYSLYSLLKRR